ncbi:MAG: hypothetical protein WB421_17915 [Terriglobales bacterium]|jgi:hypothetical protein
MKILSIVSVLFALSAAGFWGWSAFINVPVIYSGYGTLVTQMPDGSNIAGVAPFYAALKLISKLNFLAAGCAFFSALTQALTLLPRK